MSTGNIGNIYMYTRHDSFVRTHLHTHRMYARGEKEGKCPNMTLIYHRTQRFFDLPIVYLYRQRSFYKNKRRCYKDEIFMRRWLKPVVPIQKQKFYQCCTDQSQTHTHTYRYNLCYHASLYIICWFISIYFYYTYTHIIPYMIHVFLSL